MSYQYAKLDHSITTSTIWAEDSDTRVLWVTMLACSDRYGRVFASVPGLAHIARIPVEKARSGLSLLLSPDPDSRSKEFNGRRLEVIDGGWRILNYLKYRDKKDDLARLEYQRRWQANKRARARSGSLDSMQAMESDLPPVDSVDSVDIKIDRRLRAITHADADAHAHAEEVSTPLVRARSLEPLIGDSSEDSSKEEEVARARAIQANSEKSDNSDIFGKPVDEWEVEFMLRGGHGFYRLGSSECAGWVKAYPDLDIAAEMVLLREWLLANPRKRSAREGMHRRIVNWLNAARRMVRENRESPDRRAGFQGSGAALNPVQRAVEEAKRKLRELGMDPDGAEGEEPVLETTSETVPQNGEED